MKASSPLKKEKNVNLQIGKKKKYLTKCILHDGCSQDISERKQVRVHPQSPVVIPDTYPATKQGL